MYFGFEIVQFGGIVEMVIIRVLGYDIILCFGHMSGDTVLREHISTESPVGSL